MSRRLLLALLAALSMSASVQLASAQPDSGQWFTAKVIQVIDGDTYKVVRSNGDTAAVHLYGVDAPESDQPYGLAATRAVRQYLCGEDVIVVVEDVGSKGRTAASVSVHGGDLAKILLRGGFGWYDDRHAPSSAPNESENEGELVRYEEQAREENRGLWSRRSPVPPWEWAGKKQNSPRPRLSSTARSSATLRFDPHGPDRDCGDFSSRSQAQRFYQTAGPGDPHQLDTDGDGVACEGGDSVS